MIISQFTPSVNPNVIRWKRIIEELQKLNYNITILTTKAQRKDLDYLENEVRIVRTGHNTLLDAFQYIIRSKSKRNEVGDNVGNVSNKTTFLRQCAEKIMDWTWRKIYWPDGSAIWYLPAIFTAKKLIKKDNYDVVISVGLPFTAHLIGLFCKKQDKNIKWIMDIEDPFCYSDIFWVNNFSIYKNLNIRKEKECFEWADGISLTNKVALDKYLALFKFASPKLMVIPPLLNVYQNPGDTSTDVDYKAYNLGYFGSFYHKVREPKRLIDFLMAIRSVNPIFFSKIKVYIACQLNAKYANYFQNIDPDIKDKIVFLGFLEHKDTQQWMSKMDVLLNVSNTTEYHLPSKIVDYLAAKKPIVNLISTENDSVKKLIAEKYFIHIMDDASRQEIENAICYILNGKTNIFDHDIHLSQFSPAEITKQYLNLIKKVD